MLFASSWKIEYIVRQLEDTILLEKHSLLLHSKLARLTRTKLSSCALERDRLLQKTLLGCDREVVGSNPARALFLKIHKRQIF